MHSADCVRNKILLLLVSSLAEGIFRILTNSVDPDQPASDLDPQFLSNRLFKIYSVCHAAFVVLQNLVNVRVTFMLKKASHGNVYMF